MRLARMQQEATTLSELITMLTRQAGVNKNLSPNLSLSRASDQVITSLLSHLSNAKEQLKAANQRMTRTAETMLANELEELVRREWTEIGYVPW